MREHLATEWKYLTELSGCSEEEVMMLIYEMVKSYVEEFESFDKSSLSRRHYDETYAQHHRDTLEAEFVKICIPRQEHFGAIIKRHREARKLSLLESLLL